MTALKQESEKKRGHPAKKQDDPAKKQDHAVVTTEINDEALGIVKEPQLPQIDTPESKGGDYDFSVNIVRDYYGKIDPFYLSKKDARYEYRFLRNDNKNLTMKTGNQLFQSGGWQLVPKKHCLSIGIKERELGPDGYYHQGDTILAFMPKEFYKEKEEYKREKANAPMEQINKMLKEGDSSVGTGIHDTLKGIQTAKQLRMET